MIDKNKTKDIINLYSNIYEKFRNIEKRTERNIKIDDLCSTDVLNLYVEPTNRCNLHCKFCARDTSDREVANMSMEMFKNIIDGLKKGSYITINGNGEPLLNPAIYEMIKYASSNGIFTSIITNGTALTKENTAKLLKSGLSRIQISFQSIDKNTYEEIMAGSNFEKTLYKVLRFINTVREEKVNLFISISAVKTERSLPFSKKSKQFWMKMPIDNYYEGELLSLQTDSKLYPEISNNSEAYKICADPWVCAKINTDGSVNPCPQDFSNKYVLGNVKEKTFCEIINDAPAKRFRKAIIEGDHEFLDGIGYHCSQCNTWTDDVGYNISEYLKNTYPVILALIIDEIGSIKKHYDCTYLKQILQEIENEKC
ncbi:radical SAM protein [Lachnospiraceae bacterium]|nr:radical SAM protein [Lachnospiraceae bacterium]